MTIPALARTLGLDEADTPSLRAQMESLEAQGVLFSQRRGRWSLHSRSRVVVGRLSSPRGTFAFIAPEDGSGPDVFVPAWRRRGARHGDLVLARLIGARSDRDPGRRGGRRRPVHAAPGPAAEVVAVLEHRSPALAGIFVASGAKGVVLPRDERLGGPIEIPPGGAPVPDGAVVWAEAGPGTGRHDAPRGRILEVLGAPEDPGVQDAVIERTYDLPGSFPAEVEREARARGETAAREGATGREDFTGSLVVTIDPEGARDHDDAVGLQTVPGPNGAVHRLAVHIADVAHFVPESGAVDREALRRGTSVYFPGRHIPMLPGVLSSDWCSLVEGKERLTQSVVMDFDAEGRRTGYRFADGIIRSAASLTYQEAGRLAEGSDGSAHAAMLRAMAELCRRRRTLRMRRGSLDLDLPETEVVVDAGGRPVDVRPVEHTLAHRIIEEFMLAANETVAEHLARAAPATLFRVHEDPDPEAIDALEEELSSLGVPLRRTRGTPSHRLRSLLEQAKGHPAEAAIAMRLLRALKLARYSHQAEAHFGLAAPLYTHFTSPIRRYPDLIVHRILRAARRERAAAREGPGGGRNASALSERLASVALECSRLERRAEEAERAMVAWKEAIYMKGRVGEEHQGRVSGITASAVFVSLDRLGVEGIVPLRPGSSAPDHGSRSRRMARHTPSRPTRRPYRLGEAVRVRVQAVDTFRARILLRPLSTG